MEVVGIFVAFLLIFWGLMCIVERVGDWFDEWRFGR